MNKIICITGTASAKTGIRVTSEIFTSIEKEKCYWLNNGARRVNKDHMMKPYTNMKNDLLTYPKLTYIIWCFESDQEKAKELLNMEIVKVVLLYKQATDGIVNAVFKQIAEVSE